MVSTTSPILRFQPKGPNGHPTLEHESVLTPVEAHAATLELTMFYLFLLVLAGKVVQLQTRLTAFPGSRFRVEVISDADQSCPSLALRYAERTSVAVVALSAVIRILSLMWSMLRTTRDTVSEAGTGTLQIYREYVDERQIAYITLDHVQFEHAANQIAEQGAQAIQSWLNDEPSDSVVARIIDLDGCPTDATERAALIESLCLQERTLPTAVHSRRFTPSEEMALTSNGIVIAEVLTPRLIREVLGMEPMKQRLAG